jgi:glyoxylase-like metal-dependent hydrolase (beta-lactamase superfamily II)
MDNPQKVPSPHELFAGHVIAYESNRGAQIFRIPVQAFPGLVGNVYLAIVDDYRVLIDAGSGIGESNTQLEAGLKAASEIAGMDLTPSGLTHILITHGHVDHYGGLNHLLPLTHAKLGIHELDATVLTNHVERLSMTSMRLEQFLADTGVRPERRGPTLDMYKMAKDLFHSVPVDFTFEAQGMRLGPFQMLHVPGHCPGHVVIRLHDLLFCGDHLLDHISPHQSPERVTPWTGLGHYLQSLEAFRSWSREIRLALGGHGNPVTRIEARIDSIRELHRQRLDKVATMLAEPLTIAELSRKLFGEVRGYDVLLALEEAGAHVEYLYQRGLLRVANLDELQGSAGAVPIRYQAG